MDLAHAEGLAWDELAAHKLTDLGWCFGWDDAPRRFGRCSYRIKAISLSRHLTAINDRDEVLNTIRHEVAHALAWEHYGETGHSATWAAIARRIGSDAIRCYSPTKVNTISTKFHFTFGGD